MTTKSALSDPAFMARQRQRLEQLRDQLLGGDDLAQAEATATSADRGPEAAEYEDGAQRLEESEVRLNLEDLHTRRVAAIDRALQKIADGSYGYSELSGDPIPVARLEAVPEAVLTVAEEEARERR
jgi:DnaK suppressor protein